MVLALFQIQVMMPHVSAQRQHDQQCTVFILSLPVVIAAVPAGSLPSALSLASSLSMPHILGAKMQTKHAGPDWKTQGEYKRVQIVIVLDSVTNTNSGGRSNRSCTCKKCEMFRVGNYN